jgi:DNA modification methylase
MAVTTIGNLHNSNLHNLFPKLLWRGYDIICADALSALRLIPDETVHCVITSPPYYGLRSYLPEGHDSKMLEIGFGGTVEQYVSSLAEVFGEVKRVLRPDGTIWLNIGDSYATKATGNLKRKDLIGIPWAVAFALRDSGLYLRSDVIWNKPNPMPESVTDRPTKAHEYIFLLAKGEDYYYDAATIREAAVTKPHAHGASKQATQFNTIRSGAADAAFREPDRVWAADGQKNKRSVWTVNVSPFKGAHMATFPPKLIEPCVLAGCPPQGIILDPFAGASTTGLVALEYGRQYVGIELNEAYCTLSEKRLQQFQWINPTNLPLNLPLAA